MHILGKPVVSLGEKHTPYAPDNKSQLHANNRLALAEPTLAQRRGVAKEKAVELLPSGWARQSEAESQNTVGEPLPVARHLKWLGHAISFRSGLSAIVARRQRCTRIIMYHGIPEEGAASFRAQMLYLARNFLVVSLERMVHRLSTPAGPNPHEIVLTFDDGLRNNLTIVYPVLRELGIPATFFVCPGLLGTGRWLWNHEVRCRLQSLSAPKFAALARHLGLITGSVEEVVEWMKTLPGDQRLCAQEKIQEATPGFKPTKQQKQANDIMDWKQLRSLDPELVTIGSHTLTHPILTALQESQIEWELTESRRQLEHELQRPVEYFCYPNGSHDPRVHQAAARHYRAAVTTESGTVGVHGHDPHLLPRIPSANDPALLAWRLHRPAA